MHTYTQSNTKVKERNKKTPRREQFQFKKTDNNNMHGRVGEKTWLEGESMKNEINQKKVWLI